MTRLTPVLLLVIALVLPAGAQTADGDSNADAALRSWEWWKGLSELAREQLAPKLIEAVGSAGSGASLAVESAENTSRYRALCARGSGSFRDTALCKGLQYRLGERSAWSTAFLGLRRRSGTETPAARDAAAILTGLRQELGLAKRRLPAKPQYLLHGLYDEFGRCAPPACQPGLKNGELKTLLTAAAAYLRQHGNDQEAAIGRKLQELGWKAS